MRFVLTRDRETLRVLGTTADEELIDRATTAVTDRFPSVSRTAVVRFADGTVAVELTGWGDAWTCQAMLASFRHALERIAERLTSEGAAAARMATAEE